jgi:HlyD family secretion protein
LIAIGLVLILPVIASVTAYMLAESVPEVQTARAIPLGGVQARVTLSATGYIVAHHKIDVNSKVTGRVKWVGIEKGDRVKGGQVLVELEDDEFKGQVEAARGQVEAARAYLSELQAGSRRDEIEQARDDLEQARATTNDDEITLDRTRQLARAGVVAPQQLDDAQARYAADAHKLLALYHVYRLAKLGPRQEEIERARGNLIEAEGQLVFAQAQLSATKIRAPLSGTILERTAEQGELVASTFASAAAGGPLGSVVSMADLKDLQVELDIPQDEFARLHRHQPAIVTTDAYPTRKYSGELVEISPEANREKATVQVKVQIANADDYLKPDMNATVRFASDFPVRANGGDVLVPAGSLRADNGHQYVLVAHEDRAIARAVRVIGHRPDEAVVNGLAGGEEVIVNAPAVVKDGSRINPERSQARTIR